MLQYIIIVTLNKVAIISLEVVVVFLTTANLANTDFQQNILSVH